MSETANSSGDAHKERRESHPAARVIVSELRPLKRLICRTSASWELLLCKHNVVKVWHALNLPLKTTMNREGPDTQRAYTCYLSPFNGWSKHGTRM